MKNNFLICAAFVAGSFAAGLIGRQQTEAEETTVPSTKADTAAVVQVAVEAADTPRP